MKDCLLTQLQGVVDNNALEKFDTVVIELNAFTKKRINLFSTQPFKVKIIGGGVFYTDSTYTTEDGQEMTAILDGGAYRTFCFMSASDGDKLEINGKYAFKFYDSRNATSTNATKKLPNWKYMSELTAIHLNGDDKPIIDLNLLTIGTPKLTELTMLYNKNASGSIESMVENMLAAGRNSGTLTYYAYYNNVTINGSDAWCKAYETRAEALVITFNSATSVTCVFNGNTLATYNNGVWSY